MGARLEIPGQQAVARAEWRSHWPVVLAALVGVGVSAIVSYSASLFIEPLQHQFGWSRAQIMSGQSIASVTGAICAPFTGLFVDRIGPRRLAIVAVVAICLATSLFSLATSSIWVWRALWIPYSLSIVLIQPSVWTAGVTSLFSAGRGLALAVTLCGAGFSAIIIPPMTYYMISHFGWRLAWVGLGVFWLVLALPVIWFCFSSAIDQERMAVASGRRPANPVRSSIWSSGILTRRFPQLLVGGVCIAGVVVTLAVSVVPILSANGLSRGAASGVASLLGLSSIGGRLMIGLLLDRINGRYLATFCVCLPIVGIVTLLNFPGSLAAASVAVLIFGVSLGAELDIMAYLTSRYFRLGNFGFLFGTIAGFIGLAAGNGPVLLNAVYDSYHSYRPALWAEIPICLFASLLFMLLGPYPEPDDHSALPRRNSRS